jgi:hypothetical protein
MPVDFSLDWLGQQSQRFFDLLEADDTPRADDV